MSRKKEGVLRHFEGWELGAVAVLVHDNVDAVEELAHLGGGQHRRRNRSRVGLA